MLEKCFKGIYDLSAIFFDVKILISSGFKRIFNEGREINLIKAKYEVINQP